MKGQEKATINKNPAPSQDGISQFPIVGIGASAGGLNAIQKLLENVPENTGLAFIVIQHLAATQESMLPEILSRSTKLPVTKVANEMSVEKNHVYVIPSGVTMTISNGFLKLHPKGLVFKPIDEFLRSLAVERKTQAIGVILSGTGTDGTEGLKFIKAEGGITFAQDPKTAQYPDMPRNAIAEETTYFTLSPEKIAQELSCIAKHPEITRQKMALEEPQINDSGENIDEIFAILQTAFGVNFANYKQSTVNRRISRRMVLNKIENLKKYVLYLRAHKEELQALFDDLLIGVTVFFREPLAFELLNQKIFPHIFEMRQPNQAIRVWIPGCSTGEEAYSIAIALEEFLEEKNIVDRQIQIFGTDINEKNIEKARHGAYLKSIEDAVSKNRLKRFFTSTNGSYQVIKPIRDMCVFAKHDITKDPPFSNLDLIVCRNVLIYFDSKLQERMMPLFHYGLKSDGYLVLGESESIGKFTNLFEPLTKKGVAFKKKQAQSTFDLQLEASVYSIRHPLERPEKADSMTLIEREVDKILMAEYVPASLLLNSNLDVVVFRGKIDPYISIDAGAATLNVAKIVRKELRPAIQTAVYRAKKDRKDIEDTVRFEQGLETRLVTIQVKSLKISKQEAVFFFVLFSEATKERVSTQKEVWTGKKELESAKDQQIKELSEDLNSAKLTLQTVIEQQEATNEELRSAMEELQSSNEELMSTNEELESSKEELQSTNEELTTLNEELKNRNQNLTVLNDDLSNLMGSVETAVVIVDNNFRIRRFTRQAQELLRIMPADVERPILDLRLGIPIDELEKSLQKVTSNLELIRQEIKTERGRWYQMRIRPYLTSEKKVNGAVLSFSDVTEMKKLEGEKQVYTANLEQKVKDQASKIVDSETLSAIGKTAGMVGHDIRNPLQSIASDIYLAITDLAEMPEGEAKEGIKESLEGVEKNVEYINKIVQDLQDYAKPSIPVAKETDLEVLCQEILFKDGIPKNIDAACRVNIDAKMIMIDQSMLKRILGNLVNNAVQAMPNGGKLTFSARREEVDRIVIEVQDSGVGIPEEVKPKMFTPLFTTKAKGQGFGLAVVKRLTEAMGGVVTYESEMGKGTKFIIRLPSQKE